MTKRKVHFSLYLLLIAFFLSIPRIGLADFIVTSNFWDNSMTVINTQTDTVVLTLDTISQETSVNCLDVGVRPQGDYAYITNFADQPPLGTATTYGSTISVIFDPLNPVSASVLTSIDVGDGPAGIAISADGNIAVIANNQSNTVSVINTDPNDDDFNTVFATIPLNSGYTGPFGVAIDPNGTRAYVTCMDTANVAVINLNSPYEQIDGISIDIGSTVRPYFITINSTGTRAYVALSEAGTATSNQIIVTELDLTNLVDLQDLNFASGISSQTGAFGVAMFDDTEIVASWVDNQDTGDESGDDGGSPDQDYMSFVTIASLAEDRISLNTDVYDPRDLVVSISGTESKVYVANFGLITPQNTVTVIDANTRTLSTDITVGQGPFGVGLAPEFLSLTVLTTSMPDATTNVEYSNSISVVGGDTPYTFAYSGTLPPGLSLDTSTGQIIGTPTFSGDYDFTIQVTDNNSDVINQDLSISVSDPVIPSIGSSPSSPITFSAEENGSNPSAQTLYIQNVGTANSSLIWTVSNSETWLSLNPTSGTSNGEIDSVTISVDITGLTIGKYYDTITITGNDADNSPRLITVVLNITTSSALPEIAVSDSTGSLITEVNVTTYEGVNPDSTNIYVYNSSVSTLNWTAVELANWLTVLPATGTSTGASEEVTLSFDITGLSSGLYTIDLDIIDPNSSNSPYTVTVNLNIETDEGKIIHYPENMTFEAVLNEDNPQNQTLTITNDKLKDISWNIVSGSSWLSVSTESGTTSYNEESYTEVQVDISSIVDKGIYDGILTITDPTAENSPQYVFVKLFIAETTDIVKQITLTSPEDKSVQETTIPTFEWLAEGSTDITYILQIDDNDDFSSPLRYITGITSTQYIPTLELEENVTYYWRVRALASSGYLGVWSAEPTFTITVPVDTSTTDTTTDTTTSGDTSSDSSSSGASTSDTTQTAKNYGGCFIKFLFK